MSEPKICGMFDPGGLGFCGLYAPHDHPHRLLRADHPKSGEKFRRIEWSDTERWEMQRDGRGKGNRRKRVVV